VADIEHPLVSVVGELQSHFSSSLASQNTIWNMHCTSFSFRRRCRNRRKNIRVEKENRETKRRKKKKKVFFSYPRIGKQPLLDLV
jgi:hypothetical protein